LDPEHEHSAEDDTVLATDLASVQGPGEPILGTDEVWLIDGVDPVVETVDPLMPMIEDHAPMEDIARDPMDTERETVLVSPPSSLVSTTATVVVAGQVLAEHIVCSTGEQADEMMMMLETAMERVCTWSERVEAQTSAIAERDITIWK
jgi:hypothetical protein